MHGDLPVVQRLVEEVGRVCGDMLEALLARLQGAVQLPECLRIIGYLRRLAAFPGESPLRGGVFSTIDLTMFGKPLVAGMPSRLPVLAPHPTPGPPPLQRPSCAALSCSAARPGWRGWWLSWTTATRTSSSSA
jgi:hypothetical protein